MSLLNAGVPLKAPVAGIAMGLVFEGGEYATLTDILGAEDAFGDMDFKVAGTPQFVTALQLDTKLDGIPSHVLAAALQQARTARLAILEVMGEAIDEPDEMSPYAPRVLSVKIPVDKIGEVIGPKGKMINQIQADTGADITVEDDGTIYIGATSGTAAEAALATINLIANPTMPKVGERFLGTVVKTAAFGAFVSLLPGKDGLVHISKLGNGKRVGKVEDVVNVGDKLQVEITEIDQRGKISLTPVAADAESAPALRPRPPCRPEPLGRSDGVTTRRTLLPGGLRVVTEAVPGARSVAYGIWVDVGSRDEAPELAGASHYLEHLLFKGTARRDALAIAAALDEVGGESNAFTDHEHTCYYARVLDTDLPLAVDVVSDMVTVVPGPPRGRRGRAQRRARGDRHARRRPGRPRARAVRGGAVRRPPARPARDRHGREHRGAAAATRCTASTAGATPRTGWSSRSSGGLDHDRTDRARRAGVPRCWLAADDGPAPRRRRTGGPQGLADVLVEDRPGEQANLLLGTTGLVRDDPRRWALQVLSSALGGGTSTRLFQSVREQRGLAYSVWSWASSSSDTGTFGVYAGCSPDKVDEVVRLVRAELDEVAAHGLRDAEVARSKGELRGAAVLGLEDTGARMSRVGKAELVDGDAAHGRPGARPDRGGHAGRRPGGRRRRPDPAPGARRGRALRRPRPEGLVR